MPAGLPIDRNAIAFSQDGETLYTESSNPLGPSTGVYRITFNPPRDQLVAGSEGLVASTCVHASPEGLVVSGWSRSDNIRGAFLIDPSTATRRAVSPGKASVCGSSRGTASPDGNRVLADSGKGFGILEARTGITTTIKGMGRPDYCTWSPDSQLIACVRGKQIVLIDVDDPSRIRDLGTMGERPIEWSPDSKYLLLPTSRGCALTAYGESLEVVEVSRGVRRPVESSHCKVTAGTLGWLDADLPHRN